MHTIYESSDLTEFRLEWLDLLRGQRRLSPKTLEAYERDLRQFCLYLTNISGSPASKSDFADLRTLTLRGFMAHRKEQGIDASSLSRGLSGVRSFVRFLEKRGEASSAAINLIRAPKSSANLPRPLSVDEALKLTSKDSYDDTEKWIILRDSALMSLLYGCGLRIGEALSLKVQDFPTLLGDHKDAGTLRILGKGNKTRLVPILPIVTESLEEYLGSCPFALKPTDYLFRGVRGGVLQPSIVQRRMRQMRVILGLPKSATPHAMRHSFATHLLSSGGNLRMIQELLGHSSLSTTQKYTKVDTATLLKTWSQSHPRA